MTCCSETMTEAERLTSQDCCTVDKNKAWTSSHMRHTPKCVATYCSEKLALSVIWKQSFISTPSLFGYEIIVVARTSNSVGICCSLSWKVQALQARSSSAVVMLYSRSHRYFSAKEFHSVQSCLLECYWFVDEKEHMYVEEEEEQILLLAWMLHVMKKYVLCLKLW